LIISTKSRALDEFLKIMISQMEKVSCGTMLHKGIKSAYEKRIKVISKIKGVKRLYPKGRASFYAGHCSVNPVLFFADYRTFMRRKSLHEETFGPCSLVVSCASKGEIIRLTEHLQGHLTASFFGSVKDIKNYQYLLPLLEERVGRIIFNGVPTGVAVCHAMIHGGPYPATTLSSSTSVGGNAILRFVRPICFQNFPQVFLLPALRDSNPDKVMRLVNGRYSRR
jgi:NADP-dependent aldehyde dehydrogenase